MGCSTSSGPQDVPTMPGGDVAMLKKCDQLRTVDIPSIDYAKAQGHLQNLIEIGAIRFVKGSWLVKFASEGKPLPRRQDAPAEAFWSIKEVLQHWKASDYDDGDGECAAVHRFIVAISYCWCSVAHPDPEGFHLQRVGQVLETWIGYKTEYSEELDPDTKSSLVLDLAVFWDFLSVHQSPRSTLETALFRAALPGMQIVYGHDLNLVWKMKLMPPPPSALGEDRCFTATVNGEERRLAWFYDDRGWPFVESSVSDARVATPHSRLEFSSDKALRSPREHSSQSTLISPAAFERQLDQKTFTNGSDKAVVAKLYAKTFQTIKLSTQQMIVDVQFSGSGLQDYAEALLELGELDTFGIVNCANVGDAGFRLLMGSLAGRPNLNRLMVQSCNLSDDAMKFLRDECQELPSLEWLVLGLNEGRDTPGHRDSVTDDGACLLAEALKAKAPALQRFRFVMENVSQLGKTVLTEALPSVEVRFDFD